MGFVTIEESDDEKSIVTPDLRLRFRWTGDRWTHSIDLRPKTTKPVVEAVEWLPVAEAVEWSPGDLPSIVRPTYQDLHLQPDGDDVLALTVGQAGPHHFSASFRIGFVANRSSHPSRPLLFIDGSTSTLEIDVADRCRFVESLEACYYIYKNAAPLLVDPNEFEGEWDRTDNEREALAGYVPGCHAVLWEPRISDSYHLALHATPRPAASRLSMIRDRLSPVDEVKVIPGEMASGTTRFGYKWCHERFTAGERESEMDAEPPWSLDGCDDPRSM